MKYRTIIRPTWADWRDARRSRYVAAWGTDDLGVPMKDSPMRQHAGGVNVYDLLVLMPFWVSSEDGTILGRWAT